MTGVDSTSDQREQGESRISTRIANHPIDENHSDRFNASGSRISAGADSDAHAS